MYYGERMENSTPSKENIIGNPGPKIPTYNNIINIF